MKVAVIGVGAMGASHARVYNDLTDVDLVGVSDTDAARVEEIASKYGCKSFTDYKFMISELKPDAVTIAVPTKYHLDVALFCIEQGCHVLVEKPIADSESNAAQIIAAAEKKGVTLMIGHIERFNPVVQELKKRIEADELAGVYKIATTRLSPFPQRVIDVGVMTDLGVHDIDIMQYLIGSEIDHVFCQTAQRIHSSNEDACVGTIRFSNGVLGVLNTNWLTPKKVRELTITGEKGMFVANFLTQELMFYENEAAKRIEYDPDNMSVTIGTAVEIPVEKAEPLKNELTAFLSAIKEKTDAPVTGSDGKRALAVAHAFLKSAQDNTVVKL